MARAPHFLHGQPLAEPVDVRINQLLTFLPVHVMTPWTPICMN
jgi:hypothetical protein